MPINLCSGRSRKVSLVYSLMPLVSTMNRIVSRMLKGRLKPGGRARLPLQGGGCKPSIGGHLAEVEVGLKIKSRPEAKRDN